MSEEEISLNEWKENTPHVWTYPTANIRWNKHGKLEQAWIKETSNHMQDVKWFLVPTVGEQ